MSCRILKVLLFYGGKKSSTALLNIIKHYEYHHSFEGAIKFVAYFLTGVRNVRYNYIDYSMSMVT